MLLENAALLSHDPQELSTVAVSTGVILLFFLCSRFNRKQQHGVHHLELTAHPPGAVIRHLLVGCA